VIDSILFDRFPRPCMIFEDGTLAILEVNDAVCARYGYSREELTRMSLRDIRPPEDIAHLEMMVAERKRTPGDYRRISRHRAKSGEVFNVEVDLTRLEGGRTLCVISDLTSVGEAELRYRLLVEASTAGLAIVAADRQMTYMNPTGERILGKRDLGHDTNLNVHPDDVAKLVYNPPGETRNYTIRVLHGDGTYRWIEVSSKNLTTDPIVRGHLTAFRDVTERVEAEEALQRSEANFRMLLERSPTLTLVHRDAKALYVNRALVDRLGFSDASELVGTNTLDRVHPDDRAAVVQRIAETMAGTPNEPLEVRLIHRDGSFVIVEALGVTLVFDGQPAIVVFCRDITERKEMYARMAVADRMVSVGTLAAGVAHEINNPLAYVMGNLELLARELPFVLANSSRLPPSELYAIVADAREGAIRVSTIVRELRALSRTDESSKGPIAIEPVLASCLKMVGNELRHRARLVQEIASGLPPVDGNASRLGQVFLNLLVNAAHAIPEGRVDANSIRLHAFAEDRSVVVEIADTGVGIPPHVIGRIFDPFFTTKPIGQGTGLGLAISHEIVRALGGSISVESALGVGTTFRVVLPAAERSAPIVDLAATPQRGAARLRVLLVDDEVAVGRAITALLSSDFEVTHFSCAADALACLANGDRYDIVLCDLMMPEMSGIELFVELRERHPALARKVVFLTGGAFTEQARDFLSRTEHPPLEKPFTEATLRAAIDRVTSAASRA